MSRSTVVSGMGLFVCALLGFVVHAFSATLVWDASQGEVDGYYLYYGTSPGDYPNKLNVGNVTQYGLDGLPLSDNVLYYFALTAYNSAGESSFSDPAPYRTGDNTPPAPPTGLSVD